jgi:hypothetical protein
MSVGDRPAALVGNPAPGQLRREGADRDPGAEHGRDSLVTTSNPPLEGNESGVGLESGGELIKVHDEIGQVRSPRKRSNRVS